MKILVFPQDDNPYQTLLYSNKNQSFVVEYLAVAANSKVKTLTYMPRLLFGLTIRRCQGFRIIHIHWLYAFALPAKIPFSKRLAYVNTLVFLYVIKLLGYKIVWTVHNVLPHDAITNDDLKLRQKLALMASAKIVHSKSVISEMDKLHIDVVNCYVIGIGNYKTIYPDIISRVQARNQLKISSSDFVCIFMGRIEPYKNIPGIIEAFSELSPGSKGTRLILAGKASNQEIIDTINDAKRKLRSRLIVCGYVPDEEVQIYMRAADVALYPFSKVTTSSAVMVALSFGVPVIAPRLGALRDLPDKIGYFYDEGGLSVSLKHAFKDNKILKAKAKAASSYAQTLSWREIAQQTQKVYQGVLSS